MADSALGSSYSFDSKKPSESVQCTTVQSIPDNVFKELEAFGLEVSEEGEVAWNERSNSHPKEWSHCKKVWNTAIVVFLEFFATLVSNAGTSAAAHAYINLGVSKTLAIFAFTSVYLLGQALGGIVLPPLTEAFGRKSTFIVSTIVYAVCCVIVAASGSLAGIVAGRFIAGAVSAVPSVVAIGSIEDMWHARHRIWVVQAWVGFSIVGLALAPVMAATLSTSNTGWCVPVLQLSVFITDVSAGPGSSTLRRS